MSDENDSSSSTIRSLTKERNTQSNNIDSSETSITSPTPTSASKTTTTTTSPITSKFYHSSPFIPSSHLKAQEKSSVDSTAIQEGRPDREVQPSTTGLNGIVELRNHLPQLGSIKSSYNSEPQVASSSPETEVGSGTEKNAMADQDRPRISITTTHWNCGFCSYTNLAKASICVACYNPRTFSLSEMASSTSSAQKATSTLAARRDASPEDQRRSTSPSKSDSTQNELLKKVEWSGLESPSPSLWSSEPQTAQAEAQPDQEKGSDSSQHPQISHSQAQSSFYQWSDLPLPPTFQPRPQGELNGVIGRSFTDPIPVQNENQERGKQIDPVGPNPYSPNPSTQGQGNGNRNENKKPSPAPGSVNPLPFTNYQRDTWVSAPYSAGDLDRKKNAASIGGGNHQSHYPVNYSSTSNLYSNGRLNPSSQFQGSFNHQNSLPNLQANASFNPPQPIHSFNSTPHLNNRFNTSGNPEFFSPSSDRTPPAGNIVNGTPNWSQSNLSQGNGHMSQQSHIFQPVLSNPSNQAQVQNGNIGSGSNAPNVNNSTNALATALQLSAIGVGIGPGVNPSLAEGRSSNGRDRPSIINTGNAGPMVVQPGDWVCSSCGFVNWRRRKVCMRCFPFSDEAVSASFTDGALLAAQLAAGVDPDPSQLAALSKLTTRPNRREESKSGAQTQGNFVGQHQAPQPAHYQQQQSYPFQGQPLPNQPPSQMSNDQNSNAFNPIPFRDSPASFSPIGQASSGDNSSVFSPLGFSSSESQSQSQATASAIYKSGNSFDASFSSALNLGGSDQRGSGLSAGDNHGISRDREIGSFSRTGTENSIYAPGNVDKLQARQAPGSNSLDTFYSNQSSLQRSIFSLSSAGSLPLPKLSSAPPSIYDPVHASHNSSGSNSSLHGTSPVKSPSIWTPSPISPPTNGTLRGLSGDSEVEPNGLREKKRTESFLSPTGTKSSVSTSSLNGSFSSSLNSNKEGSGFDHHSQNPSWSLGFGVDERASTPTSYSVSQDSSSASGSSGQK